MKAARRSTAFISGALLYCSCIAAAMQYASIGLPKSFYVQFGGRNSLTVMLGEAVAVAVLVAVVAVVWGYVTLRPERRRHRPYLAWMMSGVGLAWAALLIFGAFTFATAPRSYSAPLQTLVLSSNAAPLFGALNIVGVLLGVWVAGKLARRKQLSLPSSRARRRSSAPAQPVPADDAESTQGPATVPPPH
ncbi:hypothetical protein NYO99_14350 [Pelomonas sp. UHG3]|jgi:multisubunit Na+/H+ antiporter MnhB subunit|uniref:Uncharacterized protein n=1 Tax=Roseateles hydrophilus TaxID=2975054 RepID=A0ACC6CCT2_9BURK|nr:hypothetical protein [Pelomonas sp. UHG3]MCY4746164.1 hypothetical protein [Pelomonas sp. UHG3]